jgi:hypothetical protein
MTLPFYSRYELQTKNFPSTGSRTHLNASTCREYACHSRIGLWSTQNFMAKPYTGMFIPYGQGQQTRQPLQSEPFVYHVKRHHLQLAYAWTHFLLLLCKGKG